MLFRSIVFAANNTGTLTVQPDVVAAGYGGTISGTGDLVLTSPIRNLFMVTGTVNNVGTVKMTGHPTEARLVMSGLIGANVTDVTVENNHAAHSNYGPSFDITGNLNNTGIVYFTGSGNGGNNVFTRISGTISNASGLIVNQTTRFYPVQLNAANTFTGNTLVQSGTLVLGNNLALQNSGLDTSGAGVISTAQTTLQFGGLIGSTNIASVIATGYSGITALTLNPQSEIGRAHV